MADDSSEDIFREASELLVEWDSKNKLKKCWDKRMENFNESWSDMRQPLFEMLVKTKFGVDHSKLLYVTTVVKKQLLGVKNVASKSIYVASVMLKYINVPHFMTEKLSIMVILNQYHHASSWTVRIITGHLLLVRNHYYILYALSVNGQILQTHQQHICLIPNYFYYITKWQQFLHKLIWYLAE